MIELIFQRELIWIKQTNQENVIFVTIGIFLDKSFNYEKYFRNGCHNSMQKATSFNNAAIVSIKGNYYRIHFWHMNKDDAMHNSICNTNSMQYIMHNSNLNEKASLL